MIRLALISASILLLAACGERAQTKADARTGADSPPWKGAKNSFVERGWTLGNQDSWKAHLRTRTQHQNEYSRFD